MALFSKIFALLIIGCLVAACGVKVQEEDAQKYMNAIYKERKRGNIAGELRYYAKKDFKIVPFDEIESSLYSILGTAGYLKKVNKLKARTQKRNQLGKGMVTYLILSYEVEYSNMTLLESYYFYGPSEKPKLVYVTLQL
jgi:hypothetical protein